MNIVIPMAGRGSRFSEAGYTTPKPLLPLGSKTMIEWVISNITPNQLHRFIFICQKRHLEEYPQIEKELLKLCPNCELIKIDEITEGAACTVLLAREHINNNSPLMIANSDQYIDLDINKYLAELYMRHADGLIMTFWADDPKWSYCRMNEDGYVTEVIEKEVISNQATVGIYNFSRGKDFVGAADEMIKLNNRVKGEFYVAPVYNYLIAGGAKILVKSTGRELEGMYGLGTPEDYETFLTTQTFKQINT